MDLINNESNSNSASEGRMNLRERPRKSQDNKSRESFETKFMEDFDPEKSNRERRKLKRKVQTNSKATGYDEYGRIRYNGQDVCDCMSDSCSGCFYECDNCGSTKCGPTCRQNRKFFYDSINFDGKPGNIRNKYATTNK